MRFGTALPAKTKNNAGSRLIVILVTSLTATLGFAQEKSAAPPPSEKPASADFSKPNSNHRLLTELVGKWNYTLKIFMGSRRPAVETTGMVVRQPIMDGRFLIADFSVEMLPGPDGKLQKVGFSGKSIEGYDSVKGKFVSVWMDNQSTSITTFEGTYDPASRTFTYHSQTEPEPGKVIPVREVITIIDNNHYRLDWYEHHGDREVKTVEINYTRVG